MTRDELIAAGAKQIRPEHLTDVFLAKLEARCITRCGGHIDEPLRTWDLERLILQAGEANRLRAALSEALDIVGHADTSPWSERLVELRKLTEGKP